MKFNWRRGLPALVGLFAILALARGPRRFCPTISSARDCSSSTRCSALGALGRRWRRKVKIVDIDDQSLKRVGQWPWSRSTLAALVRNLQDIGAKAIAFDVVFAEPDRTSPALLAKQWERSFGWRPPAGAARSLPDYDAELAAAFARGRVVTGFGLLAEENGAAPAISASVATIGGDPAATIQNFRGADSESARARSRRRRATAAFRSSPAATRSSAECRCCSPSMESSRRRSPWRRCASPRTRTRSSVRAERNGGPAGPVTGYTCGSATMRRRSTSTARFSCIIASVDLQNTLAAWRLLDPDQRATLASAIDGHIVLIGTSAVGLSDLRATPLNPLEPGVDLHARAIEQIMAHHFLTRPAWATGAEFLGAALLSAALVLLATYAALRIAILVAGCLPRASGRAEPGRRFRSPACCSTRALSR